MVLLSIWGIPLLSQNTASLSGNWDSCSTWGNPGSIVQNATDTKTINTGITVTSNVGWSTKEIVFNGTGAVTFSGTGTYVRFDVDNGDDKTCQVNAIQNPGFCTNSNNWNFGGWNWSACEMWYSADNTNVVTATQSLSNVMTTGNVIKFSVRLDNFNNPSNGKRSYIRVKYNGVTYATLDSRGVNSTTGTVTANNGATGSTVNVPWKNWVDVSFNLPTVPSSGVLSVEGEGTGTPGDDLQIRNFVIYSN